MATKSCLWGPNLAAKSDLGGPLLAVPCHIYAVYTRTNGHTKDSKVTLLNFGRGLIGGEKGTDRRREGGLVGGEKGADRRREGD